MANVKGKWNTSGRGRDLFPGHQNGKGDKSRITDDKAYRENYDEINWHRHDLKIGGPSGPFEGLAEALARHVVNCPECRGEAEKRNQQPDNCAVQQSAALHAGADDGSRPVCGCECECDTISERGANVDSSESEPGLLPAVSPQEHSAIGQCESGFGGPRSSRV